MFHVLSLRDEQELKKEDIVKYYADLKGFIINESPNPPAMLGRIE